MACGREALVEAAERPADWVMAGIVGAAGLEPTLAAVRRGAHRRLRQQGGAGLRRQPVHAARSRAHGATLLPVDSEHNAIWQCFDFDRVDGIEKITLTCSGGPFRERSFERHARRRRRPRRWRTRPGAWARRSRSTRPP